VQPADLLVGDPLNWTLSSFTIILTHTAYAWADKKAQTWGDISYPP
jgi:hypothetical protein